MDEPLSNLDAKLRHQMRVEIRELQKKLGITMIYVTHDQTEAMSMADKIVLMNEGHIVQQGKPKELFENPSHMFTAKFLGNPPMNIIETEHDGESHFINHNGEKIDFRQDNKKDLVFGLRPEDIKVSDKGIKCHVNFLDYQGSETIINTTLGIHEINIKTDSKKTDDLNQEIHIKWNTKDIKVFEK
jgi:sn-glycerol 3-phosphate transport system ATP-binding protein